MNKEFGFNILLIGDMGVGKSSLLLRFTDDTFTEVPIASIGIDFKIRTIEIAGQKIKFRIWDTVGQEIKTIRLSYYSLLAEAIIVADVTDQASFANVKQWLKESKLHSKENVRIVGGKQMWFGAR